MTLVEFLLARVAEEEAEAQDVLDQGADAHCYECGGRNEVGEPSYFVHRAEAVRAQIAWVDKVHRYAGEHDAYVFAESVAEKSLEYAAMAWRSHPDYDRTWHPEAGR